MSPTPASAAPAAMIAMRAPAVHRRLVSAPSASAAIAKPKPAPMKAAALR